MEADSIDSKKYLTINTHLYGLSVQPTGVRHHICTRYLAAYDWSSTGTNIWYKFVSMMIWSLLERMMKKTFRRSPAMATQSCFKSKQGKVGVIHGEDNILWAWYRQQWHTQVSGESRSSFESTRPNNVADVRSFLGLISYYHRFLLNLSTAVHPLNQLLDKNHKWKF